MAGLTTEGLVIKTESEIVDELKAFYRGEFGANLPVGDDDIFGIIIAISAEREAQLWELLEVVTSGQDPDSATEALLEAIAAITGTIREPASGSTATLWPTGTTGTVITAGSQASVDGVVFATDSEDSIALVAAWGATTAYLLGAKVSNGGNVYVCTTAGTSAGSGGPTGSTVASTGEVDGTAAWDFMGVGDGTVAIPSTAVVTGPTIATARTIVDIETPISGWDDVINLLDAVTGSDVETDEAFRARRETELARSGKGTKDAIRADVLAVADVTSVTVFENNTDTTDSDGIPPHAIEVLVEGGDDQDIWDALHGSVAAGIATHGTETGTADDSEGVAHTYSFSRPTVVDIYLAVTLIKDPETYPATGDDLVKTAITEATNRVGLDAVSSRLKAAVFGVAGVLDVTTLNVGTSVSPTTEATVTISNRELADYDTSRITVSSSDGTE